LKTCFSDAGCSAGDLELQPVKHANVPNIICTVRGATESVILVGAHFDHVAHGLGVIDNWTGASLLPSLAETVRSLNRRHTFVFVGFTDEERGLVGSYFYVSQLDGEALSRIVAMINFDSVGAGPTEVEHSTGDANLLQKLGNVAGSTKLPLTFMDADQVGTSDFLAFRSKGVPTLLFHSLTQETLKLLHRSADNYQALKMDDYRDTYRLAAAFLAYLDVTLDVRPRLGSDSPPPTLKRP
jgi:Zn-dependent M28 family amino/carboxypeptidase